MPSRFWGDLPISGIRILFILSVLLCGLTGAAWATEPVRAVDGVLDLRHWTPPASGYAKVRGTWLFYPGVLLPPQKPAPGPAVGRPLPLEGAWAHADGEEPPFDGIGFGTYVLTILPPEDVDAPHAQRLAIYLPRHRRDYVLWINGRHATRSGTVSETRPDQFARHREMVVPLPAGAETYQLVLHTSNYLDPIGKTPQPALIGTQDALAKNRAATLLIIQIGIGAGLLFAAKYLFLFVFRRRYGSYLWLGLIGLTIAVHQAALSLTYNPELFLFIGGQQAIVKALFLTLIWIMPLYVLFARSLYPQAHGRWLLYFLLIPAAAAGVLILSAPPDVFKRPLPYWLPYVAVVHAVLIFSAAKATRQGGGTSWLLLAAILLMTGVVIHDVLWEAGVVATVQPIMFNLAVVLLILAVLLDQYDIDAFRQAKDLSENLQIQVAERTRELTAAYQQAEQANHSKTRFLAVASHDLRQPLHAMGLRLDQLRTAVEAPKAQELLLQVERAHSTLSEMLAALLDISRMDGGQIENHPFHFPLQDLFDRLQDQFSRSAGKRGLRLKVRSTEAWVVCDSVLLYRVLTNLVDNAVKYGNPPGVLVGARRRGAVWSVQVWDTGPGIPAEKQEEAFREFVQLDNPSHDRSQGLGLGLSIVDRLCAQLGLSLDFASRPARGTRVQVSVPVGDPRLAPVPAQVPRDDIPQDTAQRAFRGTAVLLVEDDAEVLAATRDVLESWGCAVLVATGPEAACAEARDEDIDVIVADYDLGGGRTALQVIDEVDRITNRKNKAVIVTGKVNPEEVAAARSRTYPVLSKPVSPTDLQAALFRVLGRQPADP